MKHIAEDVPRIETYIDLHLHLDGAITPEIARQLAAKQQIALPAETEALDALLRVPADCESLNAFLNCFAFPLSLLQTKEGICDAVYLVLEQIRAQGVIYAEVRFAPQLHTQNGLRQEDAIQAAIEGLKRSELPANLILCCMRGRDNQAQNRETVELAKKYLVKTGGVVAIDLAGAEALFPTRDYQELFELADGYGIPFTIHAGEAAGADSVWKALAYGARRIGHGVRIEEDAALVAHIAREGIFLEMCPTSNRQTKAVEDMSRYPLIRYLEAGVRVTLNTDDMAISGITLPGEFRYMRKAFGLTPEQAHRLLQNAIDAAFTDQKTKDLLRIRVGCVKDDTNQISM